MSEFKATVVRVGPIEKHPNADTLGLTKVFDSPVIVKLGDFKEGELAAHVPVDSLVPGDDPRWAFLQGHNRIKAKRLRGIFSMGLLTKAEPGWAEGQDVLAELKIKKYEPPEPMSTGGEDEKCPFGWPKYVDIEGLRRWPDILKEGEEVALTEKVHGSNGRFAFMENRIGAGSHTSAKKDAPEFVWWKCVRQYELEKRLSAFPGIAIYGEVYGSVQDLRYGHTQGKVSLVLFDAMDLKSMRYFDYDEFKEFARKLELPTVPELYRGPWSKDLMGHAEGKTLLGADHVREGFVVRPLKERFDERIQRVILKRHGEAYLLR